MAQAGGGAVMENSDSFFTSNMVGFLSETKAPAQVRDSYDVAISMGTTPYGYGGSAGELRGMSSTAPVMCYAEKPQLPAGLDAAAAAVAAAALPLPRVGTISTQPLPGLSPWFGTSQYSAGKLSYDRPLASTISKMQSINLNGSMVIPPASALGSGALNATHSVLASHVPMAGTYGVNPRSRGVSSISLQPGSTYAIGGVQGVPSRPVTTSPPSVVAVSKGMPVRTAAPRGSTALPTSAASAAAAAAAASTAAMATSGMASQSGLAVRPARSPVPFGHRALAVGSTGAVSSVYTTSVQMR
mmetsp:Transcript_90696/g.240961  ORF Transcript_90696/g.240961 Transcript_90696/m.240961 type:complete len:300 (-) Transcript_90696:85-984(-)